MSLCTSKRRPIISSIRTDLANAQDNWAKLRRTAGVARIWVRQTLEFNELVLSHQVWFSSCTYFLYWCNHQSVAGTYDGQAARWIVRPRVQDPKTSGFYSLWFCVFYWRAFQWSKRHVLPWVLKNNFHTKVCFSLVLISRHLHFFDANAIFSCGQ